MGPRGVLMVGPPGTGKTLMARAVAGEAEVPFLALTGSSFVEMFVGVGAPRVRDLFADARKRAPSIIFIDEIDAIGQRRGGSIVSNDEREQTLNQLLAEMDGFEPGTGVVVMAATNRPEVLDPALLRPGRFDREVEIPLPNQAERAAILPSTAKGKQLAKDVDLDAVARATPGFSGADLANLINEGAIVAVRHDRDVISARTSTKPATASSWAGARRPTRSSPTRSTPWPSTSRATPWSPLLSEHADPVAKVTDPALGPGPGCHRAAARGRTPPLHRELPPRLARRPPGRPGRRGAGARRGLHGGGQRPGGSDRARPAHGAGVGTVEIDSAPSATAPTGRATSGAGPWARPAPTPRPRSGHRRRGQPPAGRSRRRAPAPC